MRFQRCKMSWILAFTLVIAGLSADPESSGFQSQVSLPSGDVIALYLYKEITSEFGTNCEETPGWRLRSVNFDEKLSYFDLTLTVHWEEIRNDDLKKNDDVDKRALIDAFRSKARLPSCIECQQFQIFLEFWRSIEAQTGIGLTESMAQEFIGKLLVNLVVIDKQERRGVWIMSSTKGLKSVVLPLDELQKRLEKN